MDRIFHLSFVTQSAAKLPLCWAPSISSVRRKWDYGMFTIPSLLFTLFHPHRKEETNDIIIHKCKERCSCCYRHTNFHSALFLGGFIFVMLSSTLSLLDQLSRAQKRAGGRTTYSSCTLRENWSIRRPLRSLPGYSVSWNILNSFFFFFFIVNCV